jgi:hypothetical protein
MSLADARRAYAREIQAVARLTSAALVEALARVPRERFLGSGPWQIAQPFDPKNPYRLTPDDRPEQVYHDVVVAIDPARNLNNGQPSALACWMDAVAPRPRPRRCWGDLGWARRRWPAATRCCNRRCGLGLRLGDRRRWRCRRTRPHKSEPLLPATRPPCAGFSMKSHGRASEGRCKESLCGARSACPEARNDSRQLVSKKVEPSCPLALAPRLRGEREG